MGLNGRVDSASESKTRDPRFEAARRRFFLFFEKEIIVKKVSDTTVRNKRSKFLSPPRHGLVGKHISREQGGR